MQSPYPTPIPLETAPAGGAPIAFPEPRGGGGQVTVLTRPTALRQLTPHASIPVDDATAVILGTSTAALATVSVRVPGEHRVGTRTTPAEIQLRFSAAEGAQVALAIPVVHGPRTPAFDDFLGGVLDLHALLARPRSLAAYHGTDTVPPFQTPVMWLVALQPITARTAQLADLVSNQPRPLPPRSLQASQGRPVVRLRAKVLVLRTGESGSDSGELQRR